MKKENKVDNIEDVFINSNNFFVENDINLPYETIDNLLKKSEITLLKKYNLSYKSSMRVEKEKNIKVLTISLDYEELGFDKEKTREELIYYELALYLLNNKDNYNHKTLFSNTPYLKAYMLANYLEYAKDNVLYIPKQEKQYTKKLENKIN